MKDKYVQASKKPTAKVAAAGIGGSLGIAITTVLIWALGQYGVEVPQDVGLSMSVIIGGLITLASAIIPAYFVRDYRQGSEIS